MCSQCVHKIRIGLDGIHPSNSQSGGLVLPSQAWLKLAPFEDPELGAELRGRHTFWQNKEGIRWDPKGQGAGLAGDIPQVCANLNLIENNT